MENQPPKTRFKSMISIGNWLKMNTCVTILNCWTEEHYYYHQWSKIINCKKKAAWLQMSRKLNLKYLKKSENNIDSSDNLYIVCNQLMTDFCSIYHQISTVLFTNAVGANFAYFYLLFVIYMDFKCWLQCVNYFLCSLQNILL